VPQAGRQCGGRGDRDASGNEKVDMMEILADSSKLAISDRESGSRPQSDLCSGRSFTPPKGQLPYSLLSYLSTNHLDEGEVIGFNRI